MVLSEPIFGLQQGGFTPMGATRLTRGVFRPMRTISQARHSNLRNILAGTQLTFAKYARETSIKGAISDAKDVKSNVSTI